MARQYTRVARLLRILSLIQSRSDLNACRLAELCGTTTRNVYRDLKMLEGAGVPYEFDQVTGGYRVRGDFFMAPVDLTLDESLAVLALTDRVGRREQIAFMRPLVRAVEKIRGRLPAGIRQEVERLDGCIEIRLARGEGDDAAKDVFQALREAIARRRILSCSYDSARSGKRPGPKEVFEFKPYCLFWGKRAWYVVGHHGGRGEVRHLKLSRFTRIQPTDRPYGIPDDFSLDDYHGKAWRMIRGDKRYRVEIWFDSLFAETIADTHWHDTQQIQWHGDDSITFKCEVDGLDEIVWWVLSMGPHCQVRKPKVLADRVRDMAREMLAVYGRTGRRSPKGAGGRGKGGDTMKHGSRSSVEKTAGRD